MHCQVNSTDANTALQLQRFLRSIKFPPLLAGALHLQGGGIHLAGAPAAANISHHHNAEHTTPPTLPLTMHTQPPAVVSDSPQTTQHATSAPWQSWARSIRLKLAGTPWQTWARSTRSKPLRMVQLLCLAATSYLVWKAIGCLCGRKSRNTGASNSELRVRSTSKSSSERTRLVDSAPAPAELMARSGSCVSYR